MKFEVITGTLNLIGEAFDAVDRGERPEKVASLATAAFGALLRGQLDLRASQRGQGSPSAS